MNPNGSDPAKTSVDSHDLRNTMKAADLKCIFVKIWRDGLVVAPTYLIILALIGAAIYSTTGDKEAALWICGIALGASIVLMSIAYWVLPSTKSPIFEKCSETLTVVSKQSVKNEAFETVKRLASGDD